MLLYSYFMDKKRSVLNVVISVISKIILLILALLVRRCVIKYTGNMLNGLSSLFASLIGFLSIAELGIGMAINFCMYRPIVEKNQKKVSALYNLYKKVYFFVAIGSLIIGLAMLPLLPIITKGYTTDLNIYGLFLLLLLATEISFVYSAKTSLINAYKNNYITTLFSAIATIMRYVLQIVVLVVWHSFTWYLLAHLVSTLIEWALTSVYTRCHYHDIITTKEKVDYETRKEVIKNTKALFMHKAGGLLLNTADSLIISAFTSVVVLGMYTNYITIVTSMTAVLNLFFTPLTAIIGHHHVECHPVEEKTYFRFLYLLNFILGIIFFLGFYAVIDDLIVIWLGKELIMERNLSIVITINYFIQFMRNAVLVYRDATGTFYNDRWRPLLSTIVNVVLSILFVKWWGIIGIIAATIITNLCIDHIFEPLVLYRHAFHQPVYKYYLINFSLIIFFCVTLAITHFLLQDVGNPWLNILINGSIAVAIGGCAIIFILLVSKQARKLFWKGCRALVNIVVKRKRT